jgi:hypothetical protein
VKVPALRIAAASMLCLGGAAMAQPATRMLTDGFEGQDFSETGGL